MTDETPTHDVVEARLDGVLLAEAALPGSVDSVSVRTDDASADEPILGPTPAEVPDDVVPEVSAETPREKYARLLSEGCKPAQLIATTDAKGQLVDVQLAWS